MSLVVTCRLDGDGSRTVDAPAGSWVRADAADPDAVGRAVAGTGPGEVTIQLNGRDLTGLRAEQRSRAGLSVALCRLEPLPMMRVADVLLLALRAPRPHLWQTIAGTSRARTMMRDDEAQVRALAGRVGVAEWLDAPAVDLPAAVQALTDITRALASLPQALVLCRPGWVGQETLDHIDAALRDEQQRDGFAVLELCHSGSGDTGAG